MGDSGVRRLGNKMQQLTNAQLAAQFRALADIYEANPDIAQPYSIQYGAPELCFCSGKEQFAATVKAFGPGEKKDEKTNGMDGTISFVPAAFRGIEIVAYKAKTCERVVVGTREIPEQRIPEQVIPAAVIPPRTEEIVEWRCKPFLESEAAA